MKAKSTETPDTAVRVVKVGHCPSLSGKSKLTYEIGSAGRDDIRVRVVGNSAAGAFNPDWVGLDAIEEAFEKHRKGEPITAPVLDHLFRGKSMNTPFFVWGVLKAEGLVKSAKDSPRGYERTDSRDFKAKIQALIKSTAAPQVAGKSKNVKKSEKKARGSLS